MLRSCARHICSPSSRNSTRGTPSTNPYQYTGRERDGIGLQYNRARYYSPALGRFISEDPIGFGGGDVNLYAYVGNNPCTFRDPAGLEKTDCDAYTFPSFVDIGANIATASGLSDVGFWESIFLGADVVWGIALGKFIELVKPGGDWDYKNNYWTLSVGPGRFGPIMPPGGFGHPSSGRAWESFGNFHFGVVAAAFGFSDMASLAGAGLAQIADDTRRCNLPNNLFQDWGDNPGDQAWIQRGLDWYRDCQ